jgi:hypothetical protein
VEEELEPVARFKVQTLPYGFGDGGLSFTAECGFHQRELLHALHLTKSKGKFIQNHRAMAFILEGVAGISLGFYSAFEGG